MGAQESESVTNELKVDYPVSSLLDSYNQYKIGRKFCSPSIALYTFVRYILHYRGKRVRKHGMFVWMEKLKSHYGPMFCFCLVVEVETVTNLKKKFIGRYTVNSAYSSFSLRDLQLSLWALCYLQCSHTYTEKNLLPFQIFFTVKLWKTVFQSPMLG